MVVNFTIYIINGSTHLKIDENQFCETDKTKE